eukprot:CAMPEP_0194145846 /NCGR_PEP_ID=MMETSP0152-20130528/18861_1 /TAXON_ID=1049557 /ORGANISM="Thalassiothrix antarctica, Strain L6-D1" /LENGTH=954 /DNA_ID=CAMNT_0038846195 /DNA_START=80 /DNA_END=2944 /DNA_ORIENTATION=+
MLSQSDPTENGIDKQKKPIIVLVNPHSTGCCLAQEVLRRGHAVMALWTRTFALKSDIPTSCADLRYYSEVNEEDNFELTMQSVIDAAGLHQIVACLAGGEDGATLAEKMSQFIALEKKDEEVVPDRPILDNKVVQQESVKAAGMRSTKQVASSDLSAVQKFLEEENYPLVVKPIEPLPGFQLSRLCHTKEDAETCFNYLRKEKNIRAVICQEFLRGKEYIIDAVSKDRNHKVMMIWSYELGNANGTSTVPFGCIPVDSESEESIRLIPYVRGVLNVLGVRNGPTHTKVILTEDGPCLVEVCFRTHGGDGMWRPLCRALTGGYSQIGATIDAFLDPAEFSKLPDKPPSPFRAYGQEVFLVSHSQGKVKSMPGFELLRLLPSFLVMRSTCSVGSKINYTVDLSSSLGRVFLLHHDKATLLRDLSFIRHVEKINGFCVLEATVSNLVRPRGDHLAVRSYGQNFAADGPKLIRHFSNDRPELRRGLMRRTMTTTDASKEVVVLVDPYSSGCCVGLEAQKRGYNLAALWTVGFAEEMKSHVPLSCGGLKYIKEINEADTIEETVKRLESATGSLRIVAVLTGGEAGVDTADAVSEAMNLRTNGTDVPNRRDKKVQQELIRAAGFRATRQAGGSKFEEVEQFLKTEPFPIVLKPTESAGSDGVKLCHTFDEARSHFDLLMKSQMVNGGACGSVLCQEFLRGKEYVVDHVSRDGIHKTMMVWVYDKRPVNGADFVYFACEPVDSNSSEAKIVIPYIRGVLDVLGVRNGASHGEVMMTSAGPCLVEMNCRANGGDGNWQPLCLGLTNGYSQVDATVDAYLEKKAFSALPNKPPSPFKAFGLEVLLVSYSCGTVKATPGYEIMKKFESFVYLETGIKVGSKVTHTIDFITCIGSVILMHNDEEIVKRELAQIRQLEENNEIFTYAETSNMLKSKSKLNLSNATHSEENQNVIISSTRPEMFSH